LLGQEAARSQVFDQHLVDRCCGKVEVGDLLGQRQLGYCHLILDRARFLLVDLRLQEVADNALRRVLPFYGIGNDLIIGMPHAGKLERYHHFQDLVAFHTVFSSGCRNGRSRRSAHGSAAARQAWRWSAAVVAGADGSGC
jgi:hypothetical protein